MKGLAIALGIVISISIAALCLGKFVISPADVWDVIWARLSGARLDADPTADIVIFQIRLPRILAALLVGAALAAAGATFQGMFRNPLVSPDILGVSAGAGLGAILGIFFSQNVLMIQAFAFAGGLVTVALVIVIGAAVRRHDAILVLVLVGIAVETLLGAAISLIKILADPYNQLPAITYWLLGSLTSVNRADLISILIPICIGLAPLYLLRWRLNLLTLGEDEARALGVDTRKLRLLFIVCATLITSAAVSVSGIIGWIGLLIPHMARFLVGPDFSRLLPASLLLGGGYLVLVDTLARTIAGIEVPLGILTAVIGAPFFLWLLATRERGWQ
jgi:iron complex transport system permease protein